MSEKLKACHLAVDEEEEEEEEEVYMDVYIS